MIVMIDMGMGNLQSVIEAMARVGAEVRVASDVPAVDAASALILPGVGAFGDGMESLRLRQLVEPIRRHALERRRPLLGICLGMQLLADEGEEHGRHAGLGLIAGQVVRLTPSGLAPRVPNLGWCDVAIARPSRLLADIRPEASFYFAHSYHFRCTHASDITATIDYGGRAVAALERGSIFGVQFHPEKSQDAGLRVLHNFADQCRSLSAAA